MKKQELIHLHGLLGEVTRYYEASEEEQLEMDNYDSLRIKPTSIHKSKTDHKEAVFVLSNEITSRMAEQETETPIAAD